MLSNISGAALKACLLQQSGQSPAVLGIMKCGWLHGELNQSDIFTELLAFKMRVIQSFLE
jgi:hypothetical protein